MTKTRWLVFTKSDILDEDEAKQIVEDVLQQLDWKAPWFMISSVTQRGTDDLVQAIGRALDELKEVEAEQQKIWDLEHAEES